VPGVNADARRFLHEAGLRRHYIKAGNGPEKAEESKVSAQALIAFSGRNPVANQGQIEES
jgi:hypothetical protein